MRKLKILNICFMTMLCVVLGGADDDCVRESDIGDNGEEEAASEDDTLTENDGPEDDEESSCVSVDCIGAYDSNGDGCKDACSTTDEEFCNNTGGDWKQMDCYKIHCADEVLACGDPMPGEEVPFRCDCGATANFIDGAGCVEDESCRAECDEPGCVEEVTLCQSTGGMMVQQCHTYFCGEILDTCTPPQDGEIGFQCLCPSGMNWDETDGCFEDASCEEECEPLDCIGAYDPDGDGCQDACPETDEEFCIHTGGDWVGSTSSGTWECGIPNLPLATPGFACNCGLTANFMNGAGCVEDESCPLRAAEICSSPEDYFPVVTTTGTAVVCETSADCSGEGATCIDVGAQVYYEHRDGVEHAIPCNTQKMCSDVVFTNAIDDVSCSPTETLIAFHWAGEASTYTCQPNDVD